jgi:hypothetical protein
MGTVPIKRSVLEELKDGFVLPQTLTDMFTQPRTYTQGLAQLEYWRDRDLLIPRTPGVSQRDFEALGLEDYGRAARAVCYGHTAEVLKLLKSLKTSLKSLSETSSQASVNHTNDRLNEMLERKITREDLEFVLRTANLFKTRSRLAGHRWVFSAAGALAASLLLGAARLLAPGDLDTRYWTFAASVLILMTLIMLASKAGVVGRIARLSGMRIPGFSILTRMMGVMMLLPVLAILAPAEIRDAAARYFPAAGILFGAGLGDSLYGRMISRNEARIVDDCDRYYFSASEDRRMIK